MAKKIVFVIALIAILGFGYWWWVNRDMNTGTDDGAYGAIDTEEEAAAPAANANTPSATDSAAIEGEVTTRGMIDTCGNSLECGNRVLAECQPGATFTAQGGALSISMKILNQTGSACGVESSVAMSQLAGLAAPSLDANGDGQLSMICSTGMGMNFASFTESLKGAGLAKCSGELKAFYDSLGS